MPVEPAVPLRKNVQRQLVFGYVHRIQNLLTSYSTIYAIPSSIIHLCFSYFYLGDGHIKRQFKCVLLGDSTVGKTSMMTRLVQNAYTGYHEPTIGAAFRVKSLIVDEYTIKYEIWDTAGQERYRSLAPMYYRGASIAVVVFDITDKQTFERAKAWIAELERNMTSIQDVTIGIAANKCDLNDKYDIDMDEVKEYAEEKNAVLMQTSAKTNINVTQLFEEIGMVLMSLYLNGCLQKLTKCIFRL